MVSTKSARRGGSPEKHARNAAIIEARRQQKTLREIAAEQDVSFQRVRQILARHVYHHPAEAETMLGDVRDYYHNDNAVDNSN